MKRRLIRNMISLLLAAAMTLCVSATVFAAEGKRYVHTVYNEQNGLPTSEANVVTQTSDGYIWIGSYGGLIRYDGSNFRNYSLEGMIPSSSIRSLSEDDIGRLWVGTNDAGVFLFEKDGFTDIGCTDERLFLCIRDFVQTEDGRLYVASNSGIGSIIDNIVHPFNADGIIGETVYSIAVDSRGRLWAAMSSGRCLVVSTEGEILNEFKHDELGLSTDIYVVENDSDGNIYVGTLETGIAKISFSDDSIEPESFDITKYDTGNVSTHNHIAVEDNGDILVSGLNGYGVIFADGSFMEFGEAQQAVSVNCSIRDYEGSYWLASSSCGVVKYNVGCFGTPNAAAGLGDSSINAISKQGSSYYIGLDTGLLMYDEDWSFITNELTEKLSGIRVRDVLTDSSGVVWFAVYADYAVLRYDPKNGEMLTFGEAEGFISNRGRVLYELADGRVAAGTQHGLAIFDGKEMAEVYGASDGMETPIILSLLESADGTVYAGSDGGGIYAVKDGAVTNYGFDEGLSDGVILRMISSPEGGVFISAGSSLYYWENDTFRRLDNFERGAGSFFDLYDRVGKLWLMQNSGILAVDKQELLSGKKTDSQLYSFGHGLTGSLNANTWNYLDDNGTLYIATRQGISTFDFRGVDNVLPRGIINSITVDGEIYEHPQTISIPDNAGRITIDFAALSYTGTTRTNIAYYLEGFDSKETVLADTLSLNVSYTNLSGGDYTFRVRIFDPEHPDISSTVSLPISKGLKLSEQPIFWVILTAIVVGITCLAAFLITKVKMDSIKRRSDEYRDIVNQSLRTFAKTIDAKDKYTNGHSIRVAEYSREIARRMKMNEQEQERIFYVALLHDIGKIGIPDHILNKPGFLTEEERAVIQTHPVIGAEILKDFTALGGITDGAKYHHERYDGKGYCERKRGEQIPLVARIIGVCDTYDAMSSDRCYRKALSKEKIIEEFKNGIGTQFDPLIVPYILEMIEDGTVPMEIL